MKLKIKGLTETIGRAACATVNRAVDAGDKLACTIGLFVMDTAVGVVAVGAAVGCGVLGAVSGAANGAAYGYVNTKKFFYDVQGLTIVGSFREVMESGKE